MIVQVWPDVTDPDFSQAFVCASYNEARAVALAHEGYGAHVEVASHGRRKRPASVRRYRAMLAERAREYVKLRKSAAVQSRDGGRSVR